MCLECRILSTKINKYKVTLLQLSQRNRNMYHYYYINYWFHHWNRDETISRACRYDFFLHIFKVYIFSSDHYKNREKRAFTARNAARWNSSLIYRSVVTGQKAKTTYLSEVYCLWRHPHRLGARRRFLPVGILRRNIRACKAWQRRDEVGKVPTCRPRSLP